MTYDTFAPIMDGCVGGEISFPHDVGIADNVHPELIDRMRVVCAARELDEAPSAESPTVSLFRVS